MRIHNTILYRLLNFPAWLLLAVILVNSTACSNRAPKVVKLAPKPLKVAVLGDTGIGKRAFKNGFYAVSRSIASEQPDILLHLGDYAYSSDKMPKYCDPQYLQHIKTHLVEPYPLRLFVVGDNDLPPNKENPSNSGCWNKIKTLATPFDPISLLGMPHFSKSMDDPTLGIWDRVESFKLMLDEGFSVASEPGQYEGVITVRNTLFVILDTNNWKDPTSWLKPKIHQARRNGLWVIVALHEPPVTSMYFVDKRDTVLKQINNLAPDLVFAGHQHSYERFYPVATDNPRPIHIVTGGGGAYLRAPMDEQCKYAVHQLCKKKHIAPEWVKSSLAKHALMNHFVILEISKDAIVGKTYRVCAPTAENQDPRWRPKNKIWTKISIECDGQASGTSLYETFTIYK